MSKLFSHKQKVELMKERKLRREQRSEVAARTTADDKNIQSNDQKTAALNLQEGVSGRNGRNPLRSVFEKEEKKAIEERKRLSQEPFGNRKFGAGVSWENYSSIENRKAEPLLPVPIALPQRPKWDFSLSKEALEKNETLYYKGWIKGITTSFTTDRLNYFEKNLEVWRQLWRVLEMSDVIVVVGDARFPALHIPYSLYHYVDTVLQKPIIYVLNKIDLIDEDTLNNWKAFFREVYPQLHVLEFTCFPCIGTVTAPKQLHVGTKKREKRTRNRKINYNDFLPAGADFVEDDEEKLFHQLDTNSSKSEKEEDVNEEDDDEEPTRMGYMGQKSKWIDNADPCGLKEISQPEFKERQRVALYIKEILSLSKKLHRERCPATTHTTIGTVGHPNVGKSSIINCLNGTKVVSVSPTPGHTKHFQTIVLDDTLTLCDCPGLTFPFLDLPRSVQILCGLFPIAQCREPFSGVQYLCERMPLEQIYGLSKPKNLYDKDDPWSPWMVCEAFAVKKGFFIHHGKGIPDAYRAGLLILRDAMLGVLPLYFLAPPPSSAYRLKELMVTPLLHSLSKTEGSEFDQSNPTQDSNLNLEEEEAEEAEEEEEETSEDENQLEEIKEEVNEDVNNVKMQPQQQTDGTKKKTIIVVPERETPQTCSSAPPVRVATVSAKTTSVENKAVVVASTKLSPAFSQAIIRPSEKAKQHTPIGNKNTSSNNQQQNVPVQPKKKKEKEIVEYLPGRRGHCRDVIDVFSMLAQEKSDEDEDQDASGRIRSKQTKKERKGK